LLLPFISPRLSGIFSSKAWSLVGGNPRRFGRRCSWLLNLRNSGRKNRDRRNDEKQPLSRQRLHSWMRNTRSSVGHLLRDAIFVTILVGERRNLGEGRPRRHWIWLDTLRTYLNANGYTKMSE